MKSYNPHTQEVRFKVHDQKVYAKGGPLDNSMNGRGGPSVSITSLPHSIHSSHSVHSAHPGLPTHPLPPHPTLPPHAVIPPHAAIPAHATLPAPAPAAVPAPAPEGEEPIPPHLLQASKVCDYLHSLQHLRLYYLSVTSCALRKLSVANFPAYRQREFDAICVVSFI